MTEEEFNEQLHAASTFIIDSKNESENFKEGGQNFKEGAELFKKLYEKTVSALSEALSVRPTASIPDEDKESVFERAKTGAETGVKDAISNTTIKAPTKEQLIPVFRAALDEIGPEITYKRVITINGKKLFWIGVAIFVVTVFLWGLYFCKMNKFDGTPESWANRMYVASKEIGEKNPGAGYDEVMTAFATGNAENAKEKVVRKENKLSELKDHRGKYERKISEYLSKDYPSGVRIVEFEEDTRQRYKEGIWGQQTTKTYSFVYAKVVTMDEQKELYIAMERLAMPFGARDPWDIHITEDARINSITNYRQKAGKVKWIYSEKKAVQ